MAFALSATAPVSLATPFEKRVAQGFAWALFATLWLKLAVAVMLTQPVIDAEGESMYNRLADAMLLGVMFAGIGTYADAILQRAPLILVAVPIGLASFLTTEALTGLNFSTAVFEYFKIVTPPLLSVLLLRLYERETALVIRLMQITLALIWVMVVFALVVMPPSLNRGGEPFWPVYFASLHTSSYLVVVCAALSLYLFEAGHLSRRLFIAQLLFSLLLVFYGWGVRTSMVAAVAFGGVVMVQRMRMAPVVMFVGFAGLLTLAFVPLLFGLIHLPSWDEMVEVTSGRFSMWLQKIDILANSTLLEWMFGHGEGSDWIVSEVWWWSAKDSHNDFIRLLNQQGVLGLGMVLAILAVWAAAFPPGVALPLLAALGASTAFSNGIMFRPQASLLMPLALVAATAAWQRISGEGAR
ncbi:hypothetical protein GCM10007933_06720 [Zoogloea oryzae]|uniref:O-antigen ligase domain-containing protein n=1 Tax=Zoogloea oryzae TaxID=310767 RepID=A0ABQ6F6Q0_9RHOO|nr:hypothetical protein [Zoogloea oryzae]GLT21220.1 hypothetical protein GCM10007933_06720 [Zoogloea oryzae]